MYKYAAATVLFSIFAICFFSCKKADSLTSTTQHSQIEKAKTFFDQELITQLASRQAQLQTGDTTLFNRNPRKSLGRKPLWAKASIINSTLGTAIVVPVGYDKPFIVKSNFGGNKMYNINELTKLLIYEDTAHRYHAELITSFPDSSYINLNNEPFTGILFIEDWWGNSILKYKYEKNGVIKQFSASKEERSLIMPSQKILHPESGDAISGNIVVQVCYEVRGYNYSIRDPTGGYYWSESAGCLSYYVPGGASYSPGTGGFSIGGNGYAGAATIGGIVPINPLINTTLAFGGNAIRNINDYNKCFTNVPGNTNTYQVKLCVTQPVPGTREPWAFQNANGSMVNGNIFFVGHTFMILTQRTPTSIITRNIGLYPQSEISPISPYVQGQLNNDEVHDFNIALTMTLTNSQFNSLLNFISQGNNPGYMYDLNTNNCTTFALNALSSIGINLPRTTGTWLNGGGLNPGDLGEDIRNMPLSSNMLRNSTFKTHGNLGICF